MIGKFVTIRFDTGALCDVQIIAEIPRAIRKIGEDYHTVLAYLVETTEAKQIYVVYPDQLKKIIK
jgi:hypothetical protein